MKQTDLFSIADAKYDETYRNWRNLDKHTGNNCLKDEPCYTFCQDMAVYAGQKDATQQMNAYIHRMLHRFCKKGENPQAYYEMVLGLMTLSWVLYYAGFNKESQYISGKYYNYFFEKRIYSKWVTDEDHMKLMNLR